MGKVEFCSIITDLRTSRTNVGYMTVTCHFIDDDWNLMSVILDTPRIDIAHTAENLAAALLKITDDWDITRKVNK